MMILLVHPSPPKDGGFTIGNLKKFEGRVDGMGGWVDSRCGLMGG